MVFAHIAVRQHVVAQALRVAQSGAVTEHDPGVRPQHGDVVGDVFRIGRADADIDQGDAAVTRQDEVIRRHLRQSGGGLSLGSRRALGGGPAGDDVAGFDEGGVGRVVVGRRRGGLVHQGMGHAHELIDVELVVGEQHEVLEVFGRGAGVVLQAVQRVVDARSGKQGQRHGLVVWRVVGAVGNAVVHRGQIGQIENIAQLLALLDAEMAFDMRLTRKAEMQRNWLFTHPDFQRNAVVGQQQLELGEQIVSEQIRPGEGGFVNAGSGNKPVSQARVRVRDAVDAHPHHRIASPHAAGRQRARDELGQLVAQMGDGGGIEGLHLIERGLRIGEDGAGGRGGAMQGVRAVRHVAG